jgi:hypothetical protein
MRVDTKVLQRAVLIAALVLVGDTAAREPAGSVCERSTRATSAAASFGVFCGFMIESTVKPPLACLQEHLARCVPAYAHGRLGFPDETHDAVFVRRDNEGHCRIVVATNSILALRSPERALAYRSCTGLRATMPSRFWEIGTGCKEEHTVEACPALSSSWPCVGDHHDHDALLCGVDDVAPRYEDVDARDVLTTEGLKLEPTP